MSAALASYGDALLIVVCALCIVAAAAFFGRSARIADDAIDAAHAAGDFGDTHAHLFGPHPAADLQAIERQSRDLQRNASQQAARVIRFPSRPQR